MKDRYYIMRLWIALSILLSSLLHAERSLYALDNGFHDLKGPAAKVALLKKLGYSGFVTRPSLSRELADACKAEGLKVLATYVTIPAGQEPLANLERHFELIKEHQTIVWLSLTNPKDGEASDEQAAMTVRKVVDLAAKYDLPSCLYPHVNFHTATVKDCERIHKMAERPNVGLSLTLCHFLAQNSHKELEATLKRIAPHLMLVQINGANQIDKPKIDWKQLIQPLGSGTFDVGLVLKTLEEIDYEGPITLQCYGIRKPANEHLAASSAAWKILNTK